MAGSVDMSRAMARQSGLDEPGNGEAGGVGHIGARQGQEWRGRRVCSRRGTVSPGMERQAGLICVGRVGVCQGRRGKARFARPGAAWHGRRGEARSARHGMAGNGVIFKR